MPDDGAGAALLTAPDRQQLAWIVMTADRKRKAGEASTVAPHNHLCDLQINALSRTRTLDPLIKSQLLYRLS